MCTQGGGAGLGSVAADGISQKAKDTVLQNIL